MSLRLRFRHWLGARVRRIRAYVNEIAVIGHEDAEAKRFYTFGHGSAIMAPQGVMYNTEHISIKEGVLIGPHVNLSVGITIGQEMIESPAVKIGSRAVVGRGTSIVGHWDISIGEDVIIGPNVYITDQNHTYHDVDIPIGAQPGIESAVEIGSGSWIATNVVILPGTRLGRNTVVGAGAVVRGEFPDYAVIAGVPARVIKVRSETGEWRRIGENR
jgi:acetyltransferase-like isoleucine patch superfamily enzyme